MLKHFRNQQELRDFEVKLQKKFGVLHGCYNIQKSDEYSIIMVPYSNKKLIKKIASTKKKIDCIKRDIEIYNRIKKNFKGLLLCDFYVHFYVFLS